MYRAVLTLLVGLMLSLSGGVSGFASSEVIWEGTEEPKFSLFGKKERRIKITSNGVFIDGKFKRPSALSYEELCRYSMLNFPTNRYRYSGRENIRPYGAEWQAASKRKRSTSSKNCDEIRVRATYDFIYRQKQTSAGVVASSGDGLSDESLCNLATRQGRWETRGAFLPRVEEAKRRGLKCGVINSGGKQFQITKSLKISDFHLCQRATSCSKGSSCNPKIWIENQRDQVYVQEAKRRGLTCGVGSAAQTQVADAGVNNAELLAAQARAAELEKQLALLQAKEELNQRQIASDNQAPLLKIIQSGANGREGYLIGSVTDNVQVAEVLVDGTTVRLTTDGSFQWSGFVPATGKDIVVEAIDTAALSSRQVLRLERSQTLQKGILRFDGLNPMSGKIAQANQNALALIVGISEYDRTNAPAIFADNDAQFFHDYAALKLGIPENNITTLLNADAGQVDVLLSVKNWLARAVKQEQSDVYIFFAGHGLASDDGEEMFLLPYDGAPELLEETTIARQKLFKEIAASNPSSVTVFLDTCYSGATRGKDVLLASRPIAIRAKEQAVPEGFTVMTAAAGDQTAKPLEEAKHGMFSYFLMKGMEGDADANRDNQITAGELHAYVQQNVIQQSSGSQTPELQGDADRVLVRFQ